MKALISLLQFTTIFPLGKPQDLENFARHSYIYPFAGYIIGGITALPVFFITDQTIAAAVAIACIFLISGAHHFDGLLDLGDGLMAHGDREKRIRALTDRQVGAGGIAAGIVVTLLLFSGLLSFPSIIFAIIIGEVCAKFSMAFLTAYGIPFRDGIHSYLHKFSKPYFPFFAGIFCLPLILLPVSYLKLAGAAIVMIL
ncbi:MAG: adenosylcobinamide-GDP ribazoletransferase, partial [Methanoregula sp.]|nr:adenosylcobinamide-GDP ribazoletransferase [Methanoregula sp.]